MQGHQLDLSTDKLLTQICLPLHVSHALRADTTKTAAVASSMTFGVAALLIAVGVALRYRARQASYTTPAEAPTEVVREAEPHFSFYFVFFVFPDQGKVDISSLQVCVCFLFSFLFFFFWIALLCFALAGVHVVAQRLPRESAVLRVGSCRWRCSSSSH